jgi:single-strand DNA-binding protein
MSSFNKITIVGHLGRDPVLRYTPQGTAVCDFSVATTERRGGAGEGQDITTWFRVTLWGKQAEVANQYLSKGKQVYVEGRLRQSEYTDKEGMKRTTLEVNASDIQFLGTRGEEGAAGAAPATKPATAPLPRADNPDDRQPSDEDIPF